MSQPKFNYSFFALMLLGALSAFVFPRGMTDPLKGKIDLLFVPIARPVHSLAGTLTRRSADVEFPSAKDQTPTQLQEENLVLRNEVANLDSQLPRWFSATRRWRSWGRSASSASPSRWPAVTPAGRSRCSSSAPATRRRANSRPANPCCGTAPSSAGWKWPASAGTGRPRHQQQFQGDRRFRPLRRRRRPQRQQHRHPARRAGFVPETSRRAGHRLRRRSRPTAHHPIQLETSHQRIQIGRLRLGLPERPRHLAGAVQRCPLGVIEKIEPDRNKSLFAHIVIKPQVDLPHLHEVAVMTRN